MYEWLSGTFAAIERVQNDFRYGVRALFRNPIFALAAILTLALGIGANAAVFSIVRGVMLRPLPFKDPDQLVFVTRAPSPGLHQHVLSGDSLGMYVSSNAFDGFAVMRLWSQFGIPIDLLEADGSSRLIGSVVTPNFFDLLGVKAALGRTFVETDSTNNPVVVLSHALWRQRFSADPVIIGRPLRLAQLRQSRAQPPYTVVGILPEDFRLQYPKDTDVFLLLPWSETTPQNAALQFGMIARLRPGEQAAQVSAKLTSMSRDAILKREGLSAELRNSYLERAAVFVEPMAEHLKADARSGVVLIASVASLFLLMACINIGLLLLARTVSRSGELALRVSLGGTRFRILQQLMTEGFVISVIGGIVGLLAAAAALPLIRSLLPPNIPRVDQIRIDAWVLGFSFVMTTMTTVVCGLAPSWIATRRDLLDWIRRSSITASSDRRLSFIRSFVIGSQVAMVLMLVVGAGLLLQSFWRLNRVDLGFRATGVITMEMRLLDPKYRQSDTRVSFQEDVLASIHRIPGVLQAGMTTAVPMRGTDFYAVMGPKNGPKKPGHKRSVDPDFFEVMHIPLRAGRFFISADGSNSLPVTIVSESYGRSIFGNETPLGKMLVIDDRETEIVGVVGDVRYAAVASEAVPAFYVPRTQDPSELMCLLVRPQPGSEEKVAGAVRDAVRAIDPDQPVEGITTIDRIVDESTADRRFYAVATGAFATVGLCLATVGLFGVVARSVSERRREIAIRAALGAAPADLLRLVVRLGLTPAACGALAGVGGAVAGSRLLRTLVFQVTPTDPWTYSIAVVLIILLAVLACIIPAVRAMRLAPMVVLKSD